MLDFGFIALKPRVFVHNGLAWVDYVCVFRQGLVVPCARLGRTEIAHALGACVGDHDVLVGMLFLLATVMQGLSFRVFWPWASAFGAIEDVVRRLISSPLSESKLRSLPFRHVVQGRQCLLQHGSQAMNPLAGG